MAETATLLKLIRTNKLDTSTMLRFLKLSRNEELHTEIIKRIKWSQLTPSQQKKIENAYISDTAIEILLHSMKEEGLSNDVIAEYFSSARFYGDGKFFFKFLEDQNLTFNELLDFAVKANNIHFWNEVAKKDDFEKLSGDDLLVLEKKTLEKHDKFRGWEAVLSSGKVSALHLLRVYAEDTYYARYIAPGIEKMVLDADTAVYLYEAMNPKVSPYDSLGVVKAIVLKNVIPEDKLFELAASTNHPVLWGVVFKVSKKSAAELKSFVAKSSSKRMHEELIASGRLDQREAFEIALSMKCEGSFIEGYQPTREEAEILLECEICSDNAVRLFAEKAPLDEIPFERFYHLLKGLGNEFQYHLVQRKRMTADQLMKIAFLAKKDYVWEAITEKISSLE